MIVVIDTSAGMEIVLSRPKGDLLKEAILKAHKVISSDLYKAEASNVLSKYVKGGFLSKEQASSALHFAQELIDEFVDINENNEEALNEAIRLNHSAYDLLFLTLARRTGGLLLTLDKKLLNLAKSNGILTLN